MAVGRQCSSDVRAEGPERRAAARSELPAWGSVGPEPHRGESGWAKPNRRDSERSAPEGLREVRPGSAGPKTARAKPQGLKAEPALVAGVRYRPQRDSSPERSRSA